MDFQQPERHAAETEPNQVLSAQSALYYIHHITTATIDQLLHEQQPATLEARQRTKTQESIAIFHFPCMPMTSHCVREQHKLFKMTSILTRITSKVLSARSGSRLLHNYWQCQGPLTPQLNKTQDSISKHEYLRDSEIPGFVDHGLSPQNHSCDTRFPHNFQSNSDLTFYIQGIPQPGLLQCFLDKNVLLSHINLLCM